MSEISSKVVEIIKDRLNVAEKDIELTSSFANDLGADSLDTVELIMEFEKEFGISIVLDANLLQHLTYNDFNMLIVDFYTLQTVYTLHLAEHVVLYCLDALDSQDVVRLILPSVSSSPAPDTDHLPV